MCEEKERAFPIVAQDRERVREERQYTGYSVIVPPLLIDLIGATSTTRIPRVSYTFCILLNNLFKSSYKRIFFSLKKF